MVCILLNSEKKLAVFRRHGLGCRTSSYNFKKMFLGTGMMMMMMMMTRMMMGMKMRM
jgi:hypothetical protein